MRRLIPFYLALFGLLITPLGVTAQAKKKRPLSPKTQNNKGPRFYLKIYSVKEPKGTKPSLTPLATKLLNKHLRRQPEVLLELGQKVSSRAELARVLAAKKLLGYELGLRVTKATHAMHPPQPGKVYKVLMVEVEVAIDMQKIPTDQLALAGEGSVQVGVETARFKEKERVDLLHEALRGAMKQAISRTMDKLKNPVITSRPKPRKRRKKRPKKRRRRR